MYKSRSMFQDVSVHSRRIYKTYSLAVGRNIYKPVIWGDSARCVFCWTRCNNEMLNWSFTRPHVMKTMIGWRVRYCHRAVSPSGVPLDEFWAPATKSGISILLLSFKHPHTSISESISKFKAFQKAMLRTMITISGLLSFFFTSYVKPMLMLTVSVSISPFGTFSSSVYTCHLRFEIHVNFAYFLDFLH